MLNENGPLRLIYLNTWSHLVELFEKNLVGVAPGVGSVLKAHSVPSWLSLPSSFVFQEVSTQLL